jgi:Bacteroides conjugation system ATPase, TraG family
MAFSVAAFGTGSKRKNIFQDIYFNVADDKGVGVVYTKLGQYSAILRISNAVQKYAADIDSYYAYANLYTAMVQTLGEGYAIHKQDIFVKKHFHEDGTGKEFLSESYFRYFNGREYTDSETYLIITQENKKSRLLSYDPRQWKDFQVKIRKVIDQLHDAGVSAEFLNAQEVRLYVDRFFAQNFVDGHFSMNNLKVDEDCIHMGDRKTKVYSLIDVDVANLPSLIRPFTNIEVNNATMPVDLVSHIDSIPEAQCVVYNQMLFIPGQKHELALLDKKKNRSASLANPNNLLAVEDIKAVQDVIARESKQLVYAHYNLMVTVNKDVDIMKCTNYLENSFGKQGIHISKHAYNQLELFVSSFPGNCYNTNEDYDRFLTLSDAATSLFYKEHIQHSEKTPLKIYYTDRQGVPVAMDITGKEGVRKLTANSNFFCLGPSGSGKSFHMNSVVRQLHEQDTDIVMVDTGNSYEGLCEYFGGKYIAYTDEKPISMNPFLIKKDEMNVEKVDFLKNLVLMIWKGDQTDDIQPVEIRIMQEVIRAYFRCYFDGGVQYTSQEKANVRNTLLSATKRHQPNLTISEVEGRVDSQIAELEKRRKQLNVQKLNFNSFYDFSVEMLEIICSESDIQSIDYSNYRKMLSNFYQGGEYDKILNEDVDASLFDETFIVFEVDAIKDNKTLFPIVTLIIMDVFLQKMRLKKNRKALIIEEAWKAIASPLMADYIKYLYKTVRKFWGTVGVVTQEIQDIISSPIVKEAIINNSDVMILLDQSKFKERFDEIKKVLGLTDIDCKKIFTINRLQNKEGRAYFNEVFVRRGSESAVYGVEEPHECYMTYTTERLEKDALKLYKRELGCGIQQALKMYCQDWDRSGIKGTLQFAQKVNAAGHVLHLPENKNND